MNKKELKQENIRLGTHGEDYGSWMSNPVFYIIGGITALAVVLAVLSFRCSTSRFSVLCSLLLRRR